MDNNARKYNKYDEVDERILALFTENKEEAFRLLYDTYYLPLCLDSVQFTGSTETSEDIVQNLFVSFWDKNSHTAISSNLHAWLFNAVRFSSLTKVQRERYFSLDELEEESYSPIDDFYDEEELLRKQPGAGYSGDRQGRHRLERAVHKSRQRHSRHLKASGRRNERFGLPGSCSHSVFKRSGISQAVPGGSSGEHRLHEALRRPTLLR